MKHSQSYANRWLHCKYHINLLREFISNTEHLTRIKQTFNALGKLFFTNSIYLIQRALPTVDFKSENNAGSFVCLVFFFCFRVEQECTEHLVDFVGSRHHVVKLQQPAYIARQHG